jgi:NTP pyrophosphatase (non-canonical NTP hydrolase)
MTDLKQLAEDSFASTLMRNPNGSDYDNIQKMYEEVHELETAYLIEDEDNPSISEHCPELTAVEEELADVVLACLVFAKCENIDVEKALRIKNEFNKTRP